MKKWVTKIRLVNLAHAPASVTVIAMLINAFVFFGAGLPALKKSAGIFFSKKKMQRVTFTPGARYFALRAGRL